MSCRQRVVSLLQATRPQWFGCLLQQQAPRLTQPSHAAQSVSSSSSMPFLPRLAQQLRSFAAGGGARQPQPQAAAARAASKAAAGAAAGTGKAAADAAAGPPPQLTGFQRWWRDFQRVPFTPKVLGLLGVIPFITLAPPVCRNLAPLLPTTISENCAMIQVCYGVVIVTFLGAVHWGIALATPLTSPIAYKMANDAYVYSVIPSLVAWPVALMEPGAGSMVLVCLLPACYGADYVRRNMLPTWYLALRVPLTVMATYGMLLTATRHLHAEWDRLQSLQEQEAAAKQA